MKKQAFFRNLGQWAANLMVLFLLVGFFQAIKPQSTAPLHEPSAEPSAWVSPSSHLVLGGAVQAAIFDGNKAKALKSKFARHAFSLEFDREDGYHVLYMFYAFVVYLFYWTIRHKLHQA